MAKKMVEIDRLIHVAKENLREVTERWEATDSSDDLEEMRGWKITVQFLEFWK